jgi:CheY-like chemotaxis protein
VDDDRTIRHVLTESLADEGYAVAEASNGREALDLLDTFRPDVILLDLMMPVMDGWAFRQHQRERRLALRARLIVVSASRRRDDGLEELGADAVIGKPFDVPQLLREVATLAP